MGGGQSGASGSPRRVQAGHCPIVLPSPSPGHLHPRRHHFSQARHPGATETLSPIQLERPCGLQLHEDPRFPVTMPTLQQKPQPMLPGLYQILSSSIPAPAPTDGHHTGSCHDGSPRRTLRSCPPSNYLGDIPRYNLCSLGFGFFCFFSRPLPHPH